MLQTNKIFKYFDLEPVFASEGYVDNINSFEDYVSEPILNCAQPLQTAVNRRQSNQATKSSATRKQNMRQQDFKSDFHSQIFSSLTKHFSKIFENSILKFLLEIAWAATIYVGNL